MRDYTRLTATLSPEDAVQLLNGYFDCLVPPIEAEGGEVLKYMGDGLLAIFREREADQGSAAQSALTAAVQARPARGRERCGPCFRAVSQRVLLCIMARRPMATWARECGWTSP